MVHATRNTSLYATREKHENDGMSPIMPLIGRQVAIIYASASASWTDAI